MEGKTSEKNNLVIAIRILFQSSDCFKSLSVNIRSDDTIASNTAMI